VLSKILTDAFYQLNLGKYEILYLYTDLRELGKLKTNETSKAKYLDQILDHLLDLGCTIIVPTFSYTTDGIFYPKSTPSHLGALNSHIINREDAVRSRHPLFSHTSVGRYSHLLENVGKSAFGNESVYAKLANNNEVKTAFLYIGRPVEAGNTMPHYIEQLNCVPYRFEKEFLTKVFINNSIYDTGYSAFVRKQDNPHNDYSFSFSQAYQSLHRSDAIKEVLLKGRFTNISIVEMKSFVHILNSGLLSNPNYFLKVPYK